MARIPPGHGSAVGEGEKMPEPRVPNDSTKYGLKRGLSEHDLDIAAVGLYLLAFDAVHVEIRTVFSHGLARAG